MKVKLSLLLMFALYLNCDKTDFPAREGIIIGDFTDMQVVALDTLINSTSFEVNVNDDQHPDFRFISSYWGGPGVGRKYRIEIISLHGEALLYGDYLMDSAFAHFDVDTIINDKFHIYYNQTINCTRFDDSDTLIRVGERFILSPLRKGQILTAGDHFKSETSVLNESPFSGSIPCAITYYGVDTCVHRCNFSMQGCHNQSENEVIYAGFMYQSPVYTRLGWFRLLINEQSLTLIEWAVQN